MDHELLEIARVYRRDYYKRRQAVIAEFGMDLQKLVNLWYGEEKLAAQEICDRLAEKGILFTPRSIQRVATEKLGIGRSVGDAYRNAVIKGRVHWVVKDPSLKAHRKRLSDKLRYEILKRDGFKCISCGIGSKERILEVDHLIAVVNGGQSISDNLRTLCRTCNKGKQYLEEER